MKVPRPSGGSRQSNGVGKIFVKYDNADSARKALQALAGRKFADRTVVTTYFAEVSRMLLLNSMRKKLTGVSLGKLRSQCVVEGINGHGCGESLSFVELSSPPSGQKTAVFQFTGHGFSYLLFRCSHFCLEVGPAM